LTAVAATSNINEWQVAAANGAGWPTYSYDVFKSRNNPDGENLPDDISGLNEIWVLDGASNSDPILANDTVYVGFENGSITAAEYRTGNQVWSYSTEASISTPLTFDDGTVYAGVSNGQLYAIDASTGEEMWNASLEGAITTEPMVTSAGIYIGTEDSLYSLDSDNGNVNWSRSTNVPVEMSPVFDDSESLLLFADGGDMYGLNPFTGSQEWHQYVGGSITEVVALGSRCYAVSDSIYTFFIGTGANRWSRTPRGSVVGSPAIYNDNMYVGTTDGRIEKIILDQSGLRDWATNLGGEIRGAPLVVDGVLYTISAESSRAETAALHAVDPDTGDQLGQMSLEYDVNRGPTVAYGNAYVSTESGVYAYSAGSGLAASFNIEPSSPDAGETVTLDASPTTEGLNPIQSYEWEFSSGSDSFEESGTVVEHTFESGGSWDITLTVTDSQGNTDATSGQITVTGVSDSAEGEAAGTGGNETANRANNQNSQNSDEDLMFGFIPTSTDQIPTRLDEVPQRMAIAAAGVGTAITAGIGFLLYRRRGTAEKTRTGTTCPSCGSDIGKGKKFCPSCGVDVTGGGTEPKNTGGATSDASETGRSQVGRQPTTDEGPDESKTQDTEVRPEDEKTEEGSIAEDATDTEDLQEPGTCPECGDDIDPSLSFCTSCGASL
jgi:outer membrane protein assembly factor BamB